MAINPKAHFCYEANPVAVAYSRHLFCMNKLQIDVDHRALGNGSTSSFYAAKDYILSSFDVPKGTKHFKKIDYTIHCCYPKTKDWNAKLESVKQKSLNEVLFGAQDCSQFDIGAYTGEVSADMIKEMGCKYVL